MVDQLSSTVFHQYLQCACCGFWKCTPGHVSLDRRSIRPGSCVIPFSWAYISATAEMVRHGAQITAIGLRGSHPISCARWGAGGGAGALVHTVGAPEQKTQWAV